MLMDINEFRAASGNFGGISVRIRTQADVVYTYGMNDNSITYTHTHICTHTKCSNCEPTNQQKHIHTLIHTQHT